MRSSPSKRNCSRDRTPAAGGRKRATVPALPQSIVRGAPSVATPLRTAPDAGLINQSSPSSSTETPHLRNPSAISKVSRERSGSRSRLGSPARAARTSARLVADFEPGTRTVASTGAVTWGAGQASSASAVPACCGRGGRALLLVGAWQLAVFAVIAGVEFQYGRPALT